MSATSTLTDALGAVAARLHSRDRAARNRARVIVVVVGVYAVMGVAFGLLLGMAAYGDTTLLWVWAHVTGQTGVSVPGGWSGVVRIDGAGRVTVSP